MMKLPTKTVAPCDIDVVKSLEMVKQSNNPILTLTGDRKHALFAKMVNQSKAFSTRVIVDMVDSASQIDEAIKEIERTGLSIEGIFRVTGDGALVKELLNDVSKRGKLVDWSAYAAIDLAAFLKVYTLKEFPSLLIDAETVRNMASTQDVSPFMASLSAKRRNHLRLIARITKAITDHHEVNKMNIDNMAKIWAPNFLQLADPMEEAKLLPLTTAVTKILLQAAI